MRVLCARSETEHRTCSHPDTVVTFVPRDAVQAVGNRNVFYVLIEDGERRFAERTVRLGAALGESLEVLDGVKPGELVVTAGSFFLRAEAGRTRSGG